MVTPTFPRNLSSDEEESQSQSRDDPCGDESVESLPTANNVRPGQLWSPGHVVSEQTATSSVDVADGGGSSTNVNMVHVLLQDLRREVLQELKGQNEVMQQILSRLGPQNFGFKRPPPLRMGLDAEVALKKKAPPPAQQPPLNEVATASEKVQKVRSSATEEDRVQAANSNRNMNKKSRSSARSQWSNFMPTIFSTFSHYDLALHAAADTQEGAHSRMVFHESHMRPIDESTPKENCVARMVHSNAFDMLCALAVMTNSIFLGIEVQLSISHGDLSMAMHAIQYAYTAWFSLELLLRLCADGCGMFCGPDWMWSILDLGVVTISLWEVVADIIYLVDSNDISGNADGVTGLKALRIVRVTRVLKVVRLMRVFRFVMAFRTLITSIAFTLKSLFWALMLLLVIVYVFAVLFAQAVNDYLADPDNPTLPDYELQMSGRYFASVTDTMLSLFMCIAAGVSWENVIAPLRKISGVWEVVFVFYVSFTYFAVLNVVTGVFCQSAIESAQNDHATMVQSILKNKEAHIAKIQALFSQLGTENTGVITFASFNEKINTPQVQAYFELLGLDVWDAWSFFKLLDLDGSGDVEAEEFLMGCLRTRGYAKGIDVGKLIHDQNWLIRSQGKFYTYVEKEMSSLSKHIKDLEGVCRSLQNDFTYPAANQRQVTKSSTAYLP